VDIGAWELGAALVKALTYVTTLGAAGLGLFFIYASPLGIAARDLSRPLFGMSGAALLLTVAKLPLLAGALNGAAGMHDPAMLRMVIMGGEGTAGLIRAAGLTALCAGLLGSRGHRGLVFIGAMLLAISFATLGHVHARHRGPLSGVLILHLICAAFWLGALWPLARVLARDPRRAAPIVARFSRLALAAVPLLIVAGVCLLAVLLDTPSALWTSDYGRWLCAKLALVIGLLALAARNKLQLTARLGIPGGRPALLRAIRLEMLLAAGVLAVTAVMTTLTGPGE
jgi:putative copper resistance protein D